MRIAVRAFVLVVIDIVEAACRHPAPVIEAAARYGFHLPCAVSACRHIDGRFALITLFRDDIDDTARRIVVYRI